MLIITCTVLLSVKPVLVGSESEAGTGSEDIDPHPQIISEAPKIIEDGKLLPAWIPVVFGIISPIFFCIETIVLRYLTAKDRGFGFNGATLSMSAYFCVNSLIFTFAIIFWQFHTFTKELFWIGLLGSIINTFGLTSLNTAYTSGPMGPVSAISACANIMLVVVESVKRRTLPHYLELIALLFGFGGALELVIPE